MNAVERRVACGCEHQPTDLIGGAEGDRTLDLRIANAALSQLSYCPTRRELSAVGTAAASRPRNLVSRYRLVLGRERAVEMLRGVQRRHHCRYDEHRGDQRPLGRYRALQPHCSRGIACE
jgi:hypothetical protein